jgi:hypothetical protein
MESCLLHRSHQNFTQPGYKKSGNSQDSQGHLQFPGGGLIFPTRLSMRCSSKKLLMGMQRKDKAEDVHDYQQEG